MQYMDPLHHPAQPQHHPAPPPNPAPVTVSQAVPVIPQPQPVLMAQGPVPAIQPLLQANPALVPVANHPPYAQMITEAIVTLNEREGSSKRAIGRYIEQRYASANLPQGTHQVLLTTHIKKLKEQGIIVMVKHSYTLPDMLNRSEPAAPAPTSNGSVKRRGRPPKPKTPAAPPTTAAAAQPAPIDPAPPQVIPPTATQNEVFASLGLSDGPVNVPVAVEATATATGTSVSGVKRGRGRPPKNAVAGAPAALQATRVIGKKSPGRPRKVAAKNAINSGAAAVAGPVAGQPKLKLDGTPAKPRGRPPRKVQDAAAPAVTGGFLAPAVYVGEGAMDPAAASASLPKRRGRPSLKPQNGTAIQSAKTPRKLSGKPLGRPRKIGSPAAVQGQTGQLSYEQLRSRFDLLQSKVRESVTALRPCLEGNADASQALQALEDVAGGVVPVQQPPQQS